MLIRQSKGHDVWHKPDGAIYVGPLFARLAVHNHIWPPDDPDYDDLTDEQGRPLERCKVCGLVRVRQAPVA